MKKYQYFEHHQCEYYPCHDFKNINCLFCYCPAYPYQDCPGNPQWLDNEIKDCSSCVFPHHVENYEKLIDFLCKRK